MLRIGTIYYSKNCRAYLPVTPTLRSRRLMAWEIDGVGDWWLTLPNASYRRQLRHWGLHSPIRSHLPEIFLALIKSDTVQRLCLRQSFSFSPKWPLTTIRWYFTGLLMTGLKPFSLYSKENQLILLNESQCQQTPDYEYSHPYDHIELTYFWHFPNFPNQCLKRDPVWVVCFINWK